MKICALYPNYLRDAAVARVLLRMSEAFQQNGTDISVVGTSCPKDVKLKYPFVEEAVPYYLAPLFYKLFKEKPISQNVAAAKLLRTIKPGDIAHLWPGVPVDTYKSLKQRNCTIVMEFINTLQRSAYQILKQEYESLGIPYEGSIQQSDISREETLIEHADYFFAPSSEVAVSLVNHGVDKSRVFESSYGISDIDRVNPSTIDKTGKAVNYLFVGYLCVRKGIHRLLKAWNKLNIDASLTLVGNIEPAIQELVSEYISNPDKNINHIPYTPNIGEIYANADVFVFPSLEEGSPLVTYLALGHGLPVIASPMGGGGVVEHGNNGLLIDPYSEESLCNAIEALYEEASLRQQLANAAYLSSEALLWRNVALYRLRQLNTIVSPFVHDKNHTVSPTT